MHELSVCAGVELTSLSVGILYGFFFSLLACCKYTNTNLGTM